MYNIRCEGHRTNRKNGAKNKKDDYSVRTNKDDMKIQYVYIQKVEILNRRE